MPNRLLVHCHEVARGLLLLCEEVCHRGINVKRLVGALDQASLDGLKVRSGRSLGGLGSLRGNWLAGATINEFHKGCRRWGGSPPPRTELASSVRVSQRTEHGISRGEVHGILQSSSPLSGQALPRQDGQASSRRSRGVREALQRQDALAAKAAACLEGNGQDIMSITPVLLLFSGSRRGACPVRCSPISVGTCVPDRDINSIPCNTAWPPSGKVHDAFFDRAIFAKHRH